MSRSGYSEEWYDWNDAPPEFYRSAVYNAINGKRGQAFLKRLAAHMDAMPEKRLVAEAWVTPTGEACALGVALQAEKPEQAENSRHWDVESGEGARAAAYHLGIAECMARELVWINDDYYQPVETPEQRWERVRSWLDKAIKPERQA